MLTNHGYALLIGVDDYHAFDASRERPLGASDLQGSRNDVRAFWRQCRALGMKPANIRVLASPPIDFRELEGASSENVGEATEQEILRHARWLAERLGHRERPTGLLTFSGHGDRLAGQGDVLCPSDTVWEKRGDGGELAHAVSFRALNEIFAADDAAENLTVVLDTCHAGGHGAPGASAKPLTLTGRDPGDAGAGRSAAEAVSEAEPIVGRVLRAAQRGQLAYQTKLDGRYRGLFSWAVSTAMEQWRATHEGDAARLDVSYGKLLETAGRLMSALWFDQTPELTGPAGIADLAVFQRGLVVRPGATAEKPNGAFLTEQIDSGTLNWRSVVMVFSDDGTALATVYVFNVALGSYKTGEEYWFVNRSALTKLGSAGITITVTDSSGTTAPPDPGYTHEQRFAFLQNASWGSGWTSDPVSGGHLYDGPSSLYLRIKTASGNISQVTWYQVLSSGSAANIDPAGSWTVDSSGSVSVPSGSTGYDISQTVPT